MLRHLTNSPGLGPQLLRPIPGSTGSRIPRFLPAGRSVLLPAARHALYWGYKAMGLPPGSRVLLPAFVCNTVSQPLSRAGARLVLFNVLGDGSPDWQDAAKRVDGAKALLWYHFVGLTNGFDQALAFCREHGLYLIEDCAHALFSRYRGRPVGSFGDIAVFSIRKSLPVLTAGALVVNNPRFRRAGLFAPDPITSPRRWASLHEREAYLLRLHLQAEDRSWRMPSRHYTYYNIEIGNAYANPAQPIVIDPTSMLVMHNTDPGPVRSQRQRNFMVYWRRISRICPCQKPLPGAAPLGFPITVPRRDVFKRRLEKLGVESTVHWPDWLLPPGAVKKFPAAKQIADRILTLPTHQDLNEADIAYACDCVEKLV